MSNEEFTLRSPSIVPDKPMPERYIYNRSGCHGRNLSPPLEWTGAPPDTKSFAITVFDPDAPTKHGWWHWAMVNIPSNVTRLKEGASLNEVPLGAIEGITDYGSRGYGGACPPKGDAPHRYVFTVHALGVEKLNLGESLSDTDLYRLIQSESLGTASFTVMYGR